MKNFFSKNIVLILSILFLILFAGAIKIFAVGAPPPSGGYTSGTELDPDCTPGSADCIVTAFIGFTVDSDRNMFSGSGAGGLFTTGYDNFFLGTDAGHDTTTGYENLSIGYQSFYLNTTGYRNLSNGFKALYSNTTGFDNSAIGYEALYSNTTGVENFAIGLQALYSNTTGNQNLANGYQALYANTTGIQNIAIGTNALQDNIVGNYNVAIGPFALQNNLSTGNVAVGLSALEDNTIGGNNQAFGDFALQFNVSGADNNGFGESALQNNQIGNNNTAMGNYALTNALASNNTAVGSSALYTNSAGSGNIAIGNNAGFWETGSNKLFIDNQGRGSEANGRTDSLIYGVFNSVPELQTFAVNGMLGVGTTPSSTFQVVQSLTGPGTVTITGGGFFSTCTGTNTQFTNTFKVGDSIIITATGETRAISVITSNTVMTIDAATNTAGSAYTLGASDIPLFLVKANGNVGIGTSTPAYSLDVIGDGSFSGNLGIGTTPAAGARLNVEGNILFGQSSGYAYLISGSWGTEVGLVDVNDNAIAVKYTNTGSYQFGGALGGTDGLIVDSTGGVGIGIIVPSYKFSVSNTGTAGIVGSFTNSDGTCTLDPGDAGWVCPSDINLKKNINSLESGLAEIKQLRPVTYRFIKEDESEMISMGLIAQEVQPIFPKLVKTQLDGTLSLNYGGLTPVMIKAIQELDLKFEDFSNKVRTKEICLTDDTGETCITKAKLDELLLNSNLTPTPEIVPSPEPTPEPEPTPAPEPDPVPVI